LRNALKNMSNYTEPPTIDSPARHNSLTSNETDWSEGTGDDMIESREVIVNRDQHGERLDKVLVLLAPEFSRNHLQHLIVSGHVRVADVPALLPSRKLQLGQRLKLELVPTDQSQAFRPEPVPVPTFYEDEHLIVVNKPAGLVVHPAAGHWSGTLLNGLLAHHSGAASLPRAGIVHRLDKDTSGLMVVGKTLQSVTALSRAIAQREVNRQYLALAHGKFPDRHDSVVIDTPIGRDPKSRVRMATVAAGKAARTDVEFLAFELGISALRCTLHTGRTHQIRVHLSSRGHPLVGDGLYGGAPALGLERQALHAASLCFAHPMTSEPLTFQVDPPDDLASAWGRVCAGQPLR
jgi:23S rRNA pseudouridine1911/1915/1917 synthase